MIEVRNNGVPLLEQFPKAGITQAVTTLAATLSGEGPLPSVERAGNSGRWPNFWPGRRQPAPAKSVSPSHALESGVPGTTGLLPWSRPVANRNSMLVVVLGK